MNASRRMPFDLPEEASDAIWIAELGRFLLMVTDRHGIDPSSTEEQRRKATDIVKMLTAFLGKHPALKFTGSDHSLGLLAMALDGLEQGRAEPILKAAAFYNAAGQRVAATQLPPLQLEFVSFVMVAHRLCLLIGLKVSAADKWIAAALGRAKLRPGQGGPHRADMPAWSASTISSWREKHPMNDMERALLERRLARFQLTLEVMIAEGASRDDLLRWVDASIIKDQHMRALRG